jgi:hypothetical protein
MILSMNSSFKGESIGGAVGFIRTIFKDLQRAVPAKFCAGCVFLRPALCLLNGPPPCTLQPWSHYRVTIQPLWIHYAATMESPYNRCGFTMQPLWSHYTTAMDSLCNHYSPARAATCWGHFLRPRMAARSASAMVDRDHLAAEFLRSPESGGREDGALAWFIVSW